MFMRAATEPDAFTEFVVFTSNRQLRCPSSNCLYIRGVPHNYRKTTRHRYQRSDRDYFKLFLCQHRVSRSCDYQIQRKYMSTYDAQ